MSSRDGRSTFSRLGRATARLGLAVVLLCALFTLSAVLPCDGAALRPQSDAASRLLAPQPGYSPAPLLGLSPAALPALPTAPLPRACPADLILHRCDQRPRTVSLSARAARAPPSSSAKL